MYDWDYGAITYDYDTANSESMYMMSSYPHAIKLVEVDPSDDYQGGMYYLTWWSPSSGTEGQFVIANYPTTDSLDTKYAVYVTDGVVERVIYDSHVGASDDTEAGDKGTGEINPEDDDATAGTYAVDARITAYFSQYSNILYTSYDTACETAFTNVEPCLDKGDMLFIIDSRYLLNGYNPKGAVAADFDDTHTVAAATYESGNIYTIQKIYKEDPTATSYIREDRYRIVLDKHIPFDGTTTTGNMPRSSTNNETVVGVVNIFKFSPATTGNYEFVAPCSNRGTCDEGQCECFKGYTNDNCDVQSSLAV